MKNLIASVRRLAGVRPALRVRSGLVALLLLALPWAATGAEEASLGSESQACQKCHDKPGLKTQAPDGKPWALHVSTEAYLRSRHGGTDCTDCHDDIDEGQHGDARHPAARSRRELGVALNGGCKTCHKKHAAQFNDSVHAALLGEGSDKAPLCSDCHAVHSLLSVKLAVPVAETPCLKCHEAIGQAYAADVHGVQRSAKGKPAPICADCHQAHAIQAAATDERRLKDACLACHERALAQHKDWLPNAARHFEAISCPVCHAPAAERRVNLRLVDKRSGRQIAETTGLPRFEKRVRSADWQGAGLNERALLGLLREFSADEAQGDVVLRGRLEVRSGVQAHQMDFLGRAERDFRGGVVNGEVIVAEPAVDDDAFDAQVVDALNGRVVAWLVDVMIGIVEHGDESVGAVDAGPKQEVIAGKGADGDEHVRIRGRAAIDHLNERACLAAFE